MSTQESFWCVCLPCAQDEIWAVPQSSLAEIVTLQGVGNTPPEQIEWRGQPIPVADLGKDSEAEWRDKSVDTGMVAVFRGLKEHGSDYWGIALRGDGLAMKDLAQEDLQDQPDSVREHASAAFAIGDTLYQVPDLPELQRQTGAAFQVSA